MDDSQIIDLFFARSELAISELDAKYGKVCHKLAHNILDSRQDAEDEMPATCIAEITESGEVIYYVEDEPKENDEATEPATWVADVDEDEEDSPIITRASDLILDGNLSDVETSRGSGSTSFRISRSQPYFRVAIKNNGSETLHASMCFGNKNAESFWDQDIPAGGSSKKVWTANEFGKFYINFTSNPHGLNLDGTVSVRVSSNKSDLS